MARVRVTYSGGPLDGEVERMKLAPSPNSRLHALPDRVYYQSRPRGPSHVYRLDAAARRYLYEGPAA